MHPMVVKLFPQPDADDLLADNRTSSGRRSIGE
jgi:hypothetical protein